jgi:c-di-GMP-binding flagellar brake protein YcgR
MGRRREPRVRISLSVTVQGIDRFGKTFYQPARTVDISRSGAALEGASHVRGVGEEVQVEYKGESAGYRVKWIGPPGSKRAGQVGMECIQAGKYIWKEKLPDFYTDNFVVPAAHSKADPTLGGTGGSTRRPSAAAKSSERRGYVRQQVRVEAEVIGLEDGVRLRGVVVDISMTGCFVEMLSPLSVGSAVSITLESGDERMRSRGEVRSGLPGMGIGIQFKEMDENSQKALRQIARRSVPAGPGPAPVGPVVTPSGPPKPVQANPPKARLKDPR